jgi:hypothetical protein
VKKETIGKFQYCENREKMKGRKEIRKYLPGRKLGKNVQIISHNLIDSE